MTKIPTEIAAAVQVKKAELEALRVQFSKELQSAFTTVFDTFFKKYPEAYAIRWRQYTPYFNDGEPCEFRVCDPELFFQDEKDNTEDRYEEGHSVWSIRYSQKRGGPHKHPGLTDDLVKDFIAIADMIHSDDDTLQMIFGDHAEITATADGIQVDEYDHE